MPASPVPGNRPRASSPGAHRPAGQHRVAAQAAALKAQIYHHALATWFSRRYLVSAGILALIPIIALSVMRVSGADLSGADPAPAGDASAPNLA